jgi:hypothetical protein
MLGEDSNWVRNVRAAGGEAILRRRTRRRVRLEEVPVAERPAILQAWLKRTGISPVPRRYLGIDPDAPIEEFQRIAPGCPVFRIVTVAA